MKYEKGVHVDAHSEGCLSLKYHLVGLLSSFLILFFFI